MDDGDIRAVDLRSVLDLQGTDRFADVIESDVVVRGSTGVGKSRTGCTALGIHDVGAADKDFTSDGVQSAASLRSQEFGRLQQVVVDSRKQEDIRQGDISAVLGDSRRDDAHVQLLAVRSDAFSQGSEGLRQRAVLTEFDGLAAALRDRLLLTKLIMDQQGFRQVDQVVRVKSFHLIAEAGVSGDVGVGREEMQVQFKKFRHFLILHSFWVRGSFAA